MGAKRALQTHEKGSPCYKQELVGGRQIFSYCALLLLVSCSNRNTQDHNASYQPTVNEVKRIFMEKDFKRIAQGRDLNKKGGEKDSGITVLLGDLNDDGLTDAVLRYSIKPNWEDNMGGNAIGEISGLNVYINTGSELKKTVSQQKFSSGEMLSIERGTILMQKLTYAADDPRCCPSQKEIIKLGLSGSELVKLK